METETQALHRLTSYEPDREWTEPIDDPRIVQDLVVNDFERFPQFFKQYADDLPRVPLPRDLPTTSPDALAVLAGSADVDATPLDLPHLSRLLYLSAGVVRTGEHHTGRIFPFRAAGSAGARFPLEVYVAIPDGLSLPAGVHWFDAMEHALVQIGPPPTGASPAVVVTGVPWRTGWRYRERGFRHIYWDAGTMLSQLLAAADSAGLEADLYSRFPDAAVTALVGADGVHEWPVAVIALGEGAPALTAGGPAATGATDTAPLEFPLVTTAQHAGDEDGIALPWHRGAPVDADTAAGRTIEDVILSRGSQRRMRADRSLPGAVLRTCMGVAMRGVVLPHFVVVHAVDELAPGVYRWPDLSIPQQTGELRDELYRICLDQALGRDAAFVVIGAADVAHLDDRGYRDAQLAAGLVEGRLHLAAYALGAGASGMTFLDSEIPGLLGEQLDALLFTCVGVPEYRSAQGGQPGAPSTVRLVTPRE